MADSNKARIIRGWSDEELVTELRNPNRISIPETYLPLIAEAMARLLEIRRKESE